MEAARKVTWGCASDFGSLSEPPPPARAAPSDWSHVTASSGRSGRPSGTARIIFARAVGVHATAAAFLLDLLVSPALPAPPIFFICISIPHLLLSFGYKPIVLSHPPLSAASLSVGCPWAHVFL